MFKAEDLKVAIGAHTLLNVSFELRSGEALRVAGPSGAGKTTLLRVLARLDDRAGGEIFLNGKRMDDFSPCRWRRTVAYLPQKPVMLAGTVEDNFRASFRTRNAAPAGYDPGRARELSARLGLNGELLARDAAAVSGGEAARVALARSLLTDPKVLLADELTAYLDPEAEKSVEKILKGFLQGRGILLFVAHEKKAYLDLPCRVLDITAHAVRTEEVPET